MKFISIILCLFFMNIFCQSLGQKATKNLKKERDKTTIKTNNIDSLRYDLKNLENELKRQNRSTIDTMNKQMQELRDSIGSFMSIVSKSKDAKKNDIAAVVATILQAIGFLILFCAWYFQNERQAKWEAERQKQQWIFHQTMHFETQMDILEFALLSLGLDGKTEKGKDPNFKLVWKQYLEDFSVQTCQFLKNLRKMYLATPIGKTSEGTKTVNELIQLMQTRLDTYFEEKDFKKRNGAFLEEKVWNFREAQKLASSTMGNFIYEYRDKIAAEIEQENKHSNLWYIVGSIVLAVAFVVQIKKDMPLINWWYFSIVSFLVGGIILVLIKKFVINK